MAEYIKVRGDDPQSIADGLAILAEADISFPSDSQAIANALAFGPNYNRAVAENVDRALWSLCQHNEPSTAVFWADRAVEALWRSSHTFL